MYHHRINEVAKPGEGYARTHRVFERHWWKFDVPVWAPCWLLGHKPRLRWNGGMSYVECGRCPARPFNIEGMRAVFTRLDNIRPGRNDYHLARQMEPPTAEEEAFVIREISGRGAWSQSPLEFHIELPIPKSPRYDRGAAVKLHIGGRGSETAWDGHLIVLGAGIYWGLGWGGHMAERITKGRSRDIGLRVGDGKLWVNLWDTPGEWSSGQPKWWSFTVPLDPTVWLWGRRYYEHDDVGEPVTVTVITAEGTVHDDVVLKLQKVWRGWKKRPRPAGRFWYSVSWDTKSGFPYRFHDWKGDEVLGSSEQISNEEAAGDWQAAAIEKIKAHVTRLRNEEGWTLEKYLARREAEAR